jgi:hypothetical protein
MIDVGKEDGKWSVLMHQEHWVVKVDSEFSEVVGKLFTHCVEFSVDKDGKGNMAVNIHEHKLMFSDLKDMQEWFTTVLELKEKYGELEDASVARAWGDLVRKINSQPYPSIPSGGLYSAPIKRYIYTSTSLTNNTGKGFMKWFR